MIGGLPELDSRWHDRIGTPLRLGVGLNTGPALCGNTGSKHKFKYGPLGHTVNLGSRTEGATKYFSIPVLITGSTRAQLGDAFAVRRLCKVRVIGIRGAVDMYELAAEGPHPRMGRPRPPSTRKPWPSTRPATSWAPAARSMACSPTRSGTRTSPASTCWRAPCRR